MYNDEEFDNLGLSALPRVDPAHGVIMGKKNSNNISLRDFMLGKPV